MIKGKSNAGAAITAHHNTRAFFRNSILIFRFFFVKSKTNFPGNLDGFNFAAAECNIAIYGFIKIIIKSEAAKWIFRAGAFTDKRFEFNRLYVVALPHGRNPY